MTGAGTGGSVQHPQGERDQPREWGSGEAGRGYDTLLPGHVWTVDSSYMCLDRHLQECNNFISQGQGLMPTLNRRMSLPKLETKLDGRRLFWVPTLYVQFYLISLQGKCQWRILMCQTSQDWICHQEAMMERGRRRRRTCSLNYFSFIFTNYIVS